MIENIPRSVLRCLTAAVKDVADSVRETGGVPSKDISAFASNMEKFMLGMVGGVFPKTKSEWTDSNAAPVWIDRQAAEAPAAAPVSDPNPVTEEKEAFRDWVKQNATKEMYEQHIGAVDALANVLRQKMDNDETGQFAKEFPGLPGSRPAPAGAPELPMDKPAALPGKPKDEPPAEELGMPDGLKDLLDDRMEDVGGDKPDADLGKSKDEKPGDAEAYGGGIFDKPQKGPAKEGVPTGRQENMDEFNTPVEELVKKKPEAATGHKI